MRANHRGGEGAAIVSSAEELRQYDFPHGPVVLGEGLSLDRSSQGTDVTAVYFFEGSDYAGAAQRVAVGPAFFGCQSLAVPEDFHRRAMGEGRVRGGRSPGPGLVGLTSTRPTGRRPPKGTVVDW